MIAFVADVHAGNHRRFAGKTIGSINARCRAVLDVLWAAAKLAVSRHAQKFVVLGDLLDYSRPEAALLREIQLILKYLRDNGCPAVLLLGNHDLNSTAPSDHAMAPLAPYATVVEKPRLLVVGELELLLVPFRQGDAETWLGDAVHGVLTQGDGVESHHRPRLLGVHLGMRDSKTAPWLATSHDAIDVNTIVQICAKHGIQQVAAGNWHDFRRWKYPNTHVTQLGALVPTGWDNPGLGRYGTVAFWDGRHVAIEHVPGPRFVSAKTLEEAATAAKDAKRAGHKLYLSMEVVPEELEAARSWTTGSVAQGELVAGEVLSDQTVAKVEARNAAQAARGAETRDAAVAAFVKQMPLPEGVDRDAVLRRTQEYVTRRH